MLCKNRITLIVFIGQDAESRLTPKGTLYTRFSLVTSVNWKDSNEYETRTESHRVISWHKLVERAGTLRRGACIEVEGELRYREYTPAESDRSIRVAEIHARYILALDRSDRQPVSTPESKLADEPGGCPTVRMLFGDSAEPAINPDTTASCDSETSRRSIQL